ncbi:MAG: hypothetical protein U9O78_00530 [Patescibacteria group bacterium]|nr:hypothetical protein [Patescibacteria group bacterium]
MVNIKKQVDKLENEMSAKQKQLEKAKKSYSKEKILRNELLLKKPGEYVIQLPELVTEEEAGETIDKKSPVDEWRELVF